MQTPALHAVTGVFGLVQQGWFSSPQGTHVQEESQSPIQVRLAAPQLPGEPMTPSVQQDWPCPPHGSGTWATAGGRWTAPTSAAVTPPASAPSSPRRLGVVVARRRVRRSKVSGVMSEPFGARVAGPGDRLPSGCSGRRSSERRLYPRRRRLRCQGQTAASEGGIRPRESENRRLGSTRLRQAAVATTTASGGAT
jgi:hypothetical protein